ncbi:glycosyltransferase [Phenylobacterium kunshanense]|nr:glycosyltransferase [Phenylobacterium kunshanense]
MASSGPIVLFCAALGGDGVARNTVHVANALARRRTPVMVVCLEGGPLAGELEGVCVRRLGRTPGPRWLALALALWRLRKCLAEARPSVVVSMGNHAHLVVWAALRGMGGVPRVYRISNDPLHGGGLDPLRPARDASLALVAADATRLVCVSDAIARRKALIAARRGGRVEVVPNGVDARRVERLARAPCDHPWVVEGAPYLVAVGRLHPQKNYGVLVEALALARAAGRSGLRLLILGRARAREQRRLARQAAALGLAEAVRFEGEVANPFPLVARAAAYVLPSRWEGASNSLLEALACGVPIVAARTAGSAPEALGHGRYGVLASPEASDLACAIVRQTHPTHRILPGARAADLPLSSAVEQMCGVIGRVRGLRDENQMEREGRRHPPLLDGRMRGPHEEY